MRPAFANSCELAFALYTNLREPGAGLGSHMRIFMNLYQHVDFGYLASGVEFDDDFPMHAFSNMREEFDWNYFNELFSSPSTQELDMLRMMGHAGVDGLIPPSSREVAALRMLQQTHPQ